jgi:hypothetical protein
MKKIIEKFAFWILRKKYIYKGTNCIILTDAPLSERCQKIVSVNISDDFKKEKIKFNINKTMLDMIEKHKGTVEDGKCFLASEDFVLGIDEEGKVKTLVDCNGDKTKVSVV